jgi:hypothetical protein
VQDLDRDLAIELLVVGALHIGHAALSDAATEPIAAGEQRRNAAQGPGVI